MKKILNETQRRAIEVAASLFPPHHQKNIDLINSVLTSVDEAEKRLAELEPKDLRTEELTFKVTYDANVLSLKKVTEALEKVLKGLPFTEVDLILPGPEDIVRSPGEGFRYVKPGEILQEGDQWMDSFGKWRDTENGNMGRYPLFSSYRRRVN